MRHRAIIYIDGLNLFYGCLRGSKYKWLDLGALSRKLLNPENYNIKTINYFSATVIDFDGSGTATRQGHYITALKTIPEFNFIPGEFKPREKTVFIKPPKEVLIENPMTKQKVQIKQSKFQGTAFEEKGTDVNIATQLLIDLYEDKFDAALLLSNDIDFLSAVRQVKNKGKTIFVVNTKLNQLPQKELKLASTSSKRKLTPEKLQDCQLPELVGPSNIRCPKEWV